jgi:hypothetical protein
MNDETLKLELDKIKTNMTTIVDHIEQQLLNNVAAALDNRASAEESLRLANQSFRDAIHTAFAYNMSAERLVRLLDDTIDWNTEVEILHEYKPKNRREWRNTKDPE